MPPRYTTEPVLLQLQPFSAHGQYVLSWRIAETLPPDLDTAGPDAAALGGPLSAPSSSGSPSAPSPGSRPSAPPPTGHHPAPPPLYHAPPPYPPDLTLRARVALDRTPEGAVYEPVRHEGTGVDEEEREYRSALLPVARALAVLAGSGQERVVRMGWEAICRRDRMENG